MEFYPGFDIESREKDMEFVYGPDVFGPKPEKRTLEAIRSSLHELFRKLLNFFSNHHHYSPFLIPVEFCPF